MTTAWTRAVVNTGKGKLNTDLKKSKWVWRPKGNYLDQVSKDSRSFMLKKGNPEILLQDHAVVDSGCSSHMTSNKAYLSDYEDFNGGFVAFEEEIQEEKSTDFVTPTKASGEAQEEEISPTILEAAKTLRRARSVAKNINTGLDAEEEINTGRIEINTGIEDVNTGSTKVDSGTASKRGQREGKALMVKEDIQATQKTK
ncbi:hypothetical protein Tco_0699126 [Tanacetum coccineum]